MNGKPAILRLWKRREAKLALLGLVLVAFTQWSFVRMNMEGTVTLEFVEIITRGRGTEEGTLAKFRLRNESGGEIRYYGFKAQEPDCEIRPVSGGTRAQGRPAYESPYLLTDHPYSWSKMPVLPAGDEVIVYVRVWNANGPWQMVMDYDLDGSDWWMNNVPPWLHKWFPLQPALGRRMQVASDPVDITVRGLDFKQRYVLAQYRRFTNSGVTNGMQMMLVTNADGSFELKQVSIKKNNTEP
ncbi:MAG: hypothetical protein K0Q55_2008 [Verrucomicrobia bacterium]|jgi:hypothetical protein|nr:hypothetical protein [Verrucomicrobiota bacterium]